MSKRKPQVPPEYLEAAERAKLASLGSSLDEQTLIELCGLDSESARFMVESRRQVQARDRALIKWALPVAEHGRKFIEGPKKPRTDATAKKILEVLQTFPDPARATAKQVWVRMENSGHIMDIQFRSFENRLTRLRKKHFPRK